MSETLMIVIIVASAVAGLIIGMIIAKAVVLRIAHSVQRRCYNKNPLLADYKKIEYDKHKLLDEICLSQYEIIELQMQLNFINGKEKEELEQKINKLITTRSEKIKECNKLQEKLNDLKIKLDEQTKAKK